MMPMRANPAQLDQIRAAIAAHDAQLAAINRHIDMMARVQAAQRKVYVELGWLYESQGAMKVSNAYSNLVDAMAQRDAHELQQMVAQRDSMAEALANMRSQLDMLENPSPIIGVDLLTGFA